MEIVLDDADMAEPEPVGLLGEIQRFPEIGCARFLLGLHIGEKLHAELHGRQDKAGHATLSRGCPARARGEGWTARHCASFRRRSKRSIATSRAPRWSRCGLTAISPRAPLP